MNTKESARPGGANGAWTFLSNHTHVLICIAADPEMRVRTIADRVGITERAANRILSELAQAGYIERERVGRRNRYEIIWDAKLRHQLETATTVGALLGAIDASVEDDIPVANEEGR